MRDFLHEAEQEVSQREVFRKWTAARIEAIHKNVTVYDVLRRQGKDLRYGEGREQQISCPFHGQDTKPSARVYPDSSRGPSHVWCFVCQERWDCINLWKKFEGFEGKFTRLLADIERAFGIITPDRPVEEVEEDDSPRIELEMLINICESRLKAAKRAFDMRGYLTLGSILDRTLHLIENRQIAFDQAKKTLMRVLNKIGERERSCPEG